MAKVCVFCGADACDCIETGSSRYWACANCGGIALDRAQCLPPDAERNRYTLHDNSLTNAGYRRYLEDFLDAVVSFPAIEGAGLNASWKLYDYGSGPEPSLVSLMRARGFEARGWDPYFSPEPARYPGGADLVTCLEVAEHFQDPGKDFCLLSECAKPGGFVAVGTHLLDGLEAPDRGIGDSGQPEARIASLREAFVSWWYRQDRTHVSFYAQKTLSLVAERAGLAWIGQAAPHVFIFRKAGAR